MGAPSNHRLPVDSHGRAANELRGETVDKTRGKHPHHPKPLISLVIPAYNEAASLDRLHAELVRVAASMPEVDFEFILVDDGSSDETLAVAKALRDSDPRVRYVSFSRHFGKEAGLLAGMRHARGDFVAPLDADLQDPPELLRRMYGAIVQESWDCVAARRTSRADDSAARRVLTGAFYRVFNRLAEVRITDGDRDFRLMSRRMVDSVLEVGERHRFSKGIFNWVGFPTKWIEYDAGPDSASRDNSRWSLSSLISYSLDGLMGFSTAPLSLAAAVGGLFGVAALVWASLLGLRADSFPAAALAWQVLACVVLMTAGVQLLCIGILGQYLARTYIEAKQRPPYVVMETEQDAGSLGQPAFDTADAPASGNDSPEPLRQERAPALLGRAE